MTDSVLMWAARDENGDIVRMYSAKPEFVASGGFWIATDGTLIIGVLSVRLFPEIKPGECLTMKRNQPCNQLLARRRTIS